MADDINPDRRTELEAHKAKLEPILRGLEDDALTLVSPRLRETFQHQIGVVRRRLGAVDAELADMDRANESHQVLLDDGFPALEPVPLDPALFAELQRENADRDAAAAIFRTDQAVKMEINLGEPVARTPA